MYQFDVIFSQVISRYWEQSSYDGNWIFYLHSTQLLFLRYLSRLEFHLEPCTLHISLTSTLYKIGPQGLNVLWNSQYVRYSLCKIAAFLGIRILPIWKIVPIYLLRWLACSNTFLLHNVCTWNMYIRKTDLIQIAEEISCIWSLFFSEIFHKLSNFISKIFWHKYLAPVLKYLGVAGDKVQIFWEGHTILS